MRCLRSEQGSALIEFSLIVPLVAFMFLAMIDFSLAIDQSMIVTEAAQTGTYYGSLAGNTTDTAGMVNAANTAAGGLTNFNATASTWCACSSGGSKISCSSSCGGSTSQFMYVQVQTSASVPLLANYPGLPASVALQGLSILRVQ